MDPHSSESGDRERKTGVSSTEAIDDVAYLVRSPHRTVALAALADGPRTRAELRDLTDVSRSTVGRTLRAFEERGWIEPTDEGYETTRLGGFVATGMRELLERVETELKLRDVWRWFPAETRELPLESLSRAVVTVAAVDDPYRPVNRFRSLLRETDRFRFVGFELALFELCRDELTDQVAGGMTTEVVDPPSVARYIRRTYPERSERMFASGNLTVLVHDGLPEYGLSLFDDRIAICGYHTDSGTVRILIDTDDRTVREWAESTYAAYRREARPFQAETPLE
ncbi:helix-turn-helix transcriptional regulator [Natronococcus occultus]|uniref:Transcriptional regulator, ArsR family n=1 Tax=Natronococcus occultus SP4 TaxID=694430 RepID=L0K5J1_9EURY|nr:MarR family transcriptional regulator [Natronococcus occultus]AGB39373.1 transcriptional regulator, ArsR family [Natronococcus occultus SP4]